MSGVVLLPSVSTATAQSLQLDIFVDGPTWENQFDSLEIWRSRLTDGGPYEPLTGDGWLPARLPLGVAGVMPLIPQVGPSTPLVGRTLFLSVNDTQLSFVFTGTDPLSFGQAAAQITAGGLNRLRAFVIGNALVIESIQPGAGVTLRVVGGDAAPLLGLMTIEPGSVSFGRDARVPLVQGITNYLFTDLNGSRNFFYKTRFFNTLTRVTSDFSLPFTGRFITTVSPMNLVRATLDLVDAHGVAMQGQKILVYNRFIGTPVDGRVVVGGAVDEVTDINGHVEFLLVRGSHVTVAIPGTNVARDIVVPLDLSVQTFNLLDPLYGSNDLFNVQRPNIEYAARRSI